MLSNFYFTLCVISSILLVEIFINFKKPISLKILMLILAASILLHNLTLYFNWGLFLNVLTRLTMAVASINLLYLLYKHRLNRNMIIASIILFVLSIINLCIPVETLPQNSLLVKFRFLNRVMISGGLYYLYVYLSIKLAFSLSENNLYSKKIKKWTKITIALSSLAIINNLLNAFFPSYLFLSRSISAGVQLTICLLLIYRPSFLNRTELGLTLSKAFKKNNLEQINEENFIYEFYTKQYYLNKNTYIDEFAKLMNVNSAALNEYIQEKTKMSFIDLVNKKRIDHFILIAADKQYQAYSIEGLSEVAGFGTRHSLYRNFKKFHGGNPSDLLRIYE